jgi:hypothetical protein
MVVEARPPLAVEDLVAGRDLEELRDELERPARRRGRDERAVVRVPVELGAADERHARVRVLERQLQVREVLVIREEHVELRPLALDEVRLEDERLELVFTMTNSTSATSETRRAVRGGCWTLGWKYDLTRERRDFAFPHVEELPLRVSIEVDPGRSGRSSSFRERAARRSSRGMPG